MHMSQSWFKPFSNFGIWDEISWDKPAGNAAGGGFLEPLDPCSLPGRAADPWGRGTAVKHSPVPGAHPSGTDLTEASGDRADFHPRRVPLQLPGSSFAAGPALCWEQSGGGTRASSSLQQGRNLLLNLFSAKEVSFYFSSLVNLLGLLKQTC